MSCMLQAYYPVIPPGPCPVHRQFSVSNLKYSCYPGDETAMESVQQIGGNLVSALLAPLIEVATEKDFELFGGIRSLACDIRGDVVLMMALAAATFAYFSGFDAPLRRTMADCGDDDSCDGPKNVNGDNATAVVAREPKPLQGIKK